MSLHLATAAAAILAVAVTIGVYLAALALYRRTRRILLHPVITAVSVLIPALVLLQVPYATYDTGGHLLAWFLAPAVVALGVPLHRQMSDIVRQGRAILVSVLVASTVGALAGAGVAALLGAPPEVARTLSARSVTTPIAMAISGRLGGIPPLAAAVSIATGMLGAVIGPPLLRACRVGSRTAFGLALGSAAHGLGTARALEEGEVEGATSGLAIALVGVGTAIVAPGIVALLAWLGLL